MDLGKDQSSVALQNTADPQQEQNRAPEFIGRWNLRNREQLRKRKAEAREQQTSQWQLGGEKKRKRQKTGKENERRGRKKQNAEPKVVPPLGMEKADRAAAAPTERETESPMDVTEVPVLGAPPPNVVPEKNLSEVGQQGMAGQEDSSKYRETEVQNQPAEIRQDTAEPEGLAPKTCQEIAIPQDLPFKTCHGAPEPEELSPQMCQDVDVPKAPLPKVSEDVQDVEGCVVETRPDLEASEGCSPDTQQERDQSGEWNAEMDQELAETGSYFPNTQPDRAGPKDLSTKVVSEPDLPECNLHKRNQQIAVPRSLSDKTIQERPELEEYPLETDQETPEPQVCAPEMYQEISGPEDCAPEMYQETPRADVCAPKMYQETPESEICAPEMYQETPEPEVCAPEMNQGIPGSEYGSPELYQETSGPEDLSTKAYTHQDVPTECFPEPNPETEIEEKPKAEDPAISASPNVPQESHPEQDIFSYVLF